MSLYFITGNKGKFEEAQKILRSIKQLDIDLKEIQHIDARLVIKAKLEEAFKYHDGPFFIEDTSLYLEPLKGLPGPLIKWFIKTIGNTGLFELSLGLKNHKAQAKTIIGYAQDKFNIEYFEGVLEGDIVFPRGDNGFAWDPIFKPRGSEKTFAEMTNEEKNENSMRKIALEKLKKHLHEI